MADTYPFKSWTIAQVVRNKLNHSFFLPAFQREFQWDEDRVIALFDSIMRGYPIGTFLLWQVKPESRQRVLAYRFISEAREGGIHNPLEDTHDVRSLTMVLDGQQRLSSLLAGLRGTYAYRRYYHKKDNRDSWVPQKLYVDLLYDFGRRRRSRVPNPVMRKLEKNLRTGCVEYCNSADIEDCLRQLRTLQPEPNGRLANCYKDGWDDEGTAILTAEMRDVLQAAASDDGELARFGAFHFFHEQPQPGEHQLWLSVSTILDTRERRELVRVRRALFAAAPRYSDRLRGLARHNLNRLHDVIWHERLIHSSTERHQDFDRVVNIFVRANQQGKQLSKSDLLFSLVTAKWEGNARQEINDFVDHINDLPAKNAATRDFVIKTCLVLCKLPVEYEVSSFTPRNLATIRSKWDDIKRAIESGFDLANSFGLNKQNLTSLNALIPAIHFFFLHPEFVVGGSDPLSVQNAATVRRWLTQALLCRAFGGHSDTVLRIARNILIDKSGRTLFPASTINAAFRRAGKDMSIDSLDRFKYASRDTFLLLSLLYGEVNWGHKSYDQDHLFAKNLFRKSKMRAAGVKEQKYGSFIDKRDRVGNLALLLKGENRWDKAGKAFHEWLRTRSMIRFRRRHLIPTHRGTWKFRSFIEFVERREDMIVRHLRRLHVPVRSRTGGV